MNSIVLLWLIANGTTVAPQAGCAPENSIPALVQRLKPNPVERYINRELVPMSLDDLIKEADLVLDATVYPLKTYLSSDECYLITDYEIRPHEVITGVPFTARVPGPQTLTFAMTGGTAVIDGVNVVTRDENLPPIQAGTRVMLFLRKGPPGDGRWHVVGEVSGAFEVLPDGRVNPMVRGAGAEYVSSLPRERRAFVDWVRNAPSTTLLDPRIRSEIWREWT